MFFAFFFSYIMIAVSIKRWLSFSGIDNIINSYIPLSKFTVFGKRENRATTPLQHFHSIKKDNFRKNKTRVERMRVVGKIIWLVGALLLHMIGLGNLKRLLST